MLLLLVAGVGMGAGQSVTVPTGDVSSVFVDALDRDHRRLLLP